MDEERLLRAMADLAERQERGLTELRTEMTSIAERQRQDVAELRTEMTSIAERQKNDLGEFRWRVMDRLSGLEDRFNGFEVRLQASTSMLSSFVGQVTGREQQIELLQGAIRAGMATESNQVRDLRQVVVDMQGVMHRLQSQIDVINHKIGDTGFGERGSASLA